MLLQSVPTARAVVGALASVELGRRLEGIVGPVDRCRTPSDIPTMAGGFAPRVVIYEAGIRPRSVADEWLAAFSASAIVPSIVVCWSQGADAIRESARMASLLPTCAIANTNYNLRNVVVRCLARRRSIDIVRQAIQSIERETSRRCDHSVVAALAIGDARRSVAELAAVSGTGVRALSDHCQRFGLPRPVTLLGWARALHVLAALEYDGESLQDVVLASGEPTSRDCADYVRYHTGSAPTAWLRKGGVGALLESFIHHMMARGGGGRHRFPGRSPLDLEAVS